MFSDVINMEQALLKSEVEEKRENMWVERLSSERKEEASCEEKDPPPPSSAVAAEYENPPKTEAEAIFRLLDVNRQGFVTRKVTRVFGSDALKLALFKWLFHFCIVSFQRFLSNLEFYRFSIVSIANSHAYLSE